MLIWLFSTALAYETDQLTWRDQPLAPADALADAQLNLALDEAVTATNTALQCSANIDTSRRQLAREIRAATSPRTRVPGRKLWRQFGYGRYTAWLESSEAERRSFPERGDLFGGLTMWQSVILTRSGPASTFNLGGELVGSDKLDHFLDTGFLYFEWSDAGADLDMALRLGTATERSLYGIATSKTFSWADLAANRDGMDFYLDLLTEGSVLQLNDEGCVERTADFHWADHAEPSWDEVKNPSVHSRMVGRGVVRRLRNYQDDYCASFELWAEPTYEADLNRVLRERPDYVLGVAPPRSDPYDLVGLCTPLRPWTPAPGVPRFWRTQSQDGDGAHD